jgi:triacylglycerol lipase
MRELSTCKSGEYDPRSAYLLCKCVGWAYLPEESARDWYAAYGYTLKRHTADSVSVDIANNGDSTVIAFAGTNDLDDWFVNLDIGKVDWNGYQVHAGFHEAEQSLFEAAADEYGPELTDVWICGHSMGGALATLLGLRFADSIGGGKALRGVYTYGSPRCMDSRAVHMCDLLMGKLHYRHDNGNDIVPRVPTCFRFKHCGRYVRINRHGKVVHNPSPVYTFIDRVLGYRGDLLRNHFVQKYLTPLLLESK